MVDEIREELQDTMADLTFCRWIEATLELERTAFKNDPGAMTGDTLANWWLAMGYAAADEIHEMMGELRWKPWTTNRGDIVDRRAFISEAADAMHFVALLLASVECTGEELTAAYLAKMDRNRARQAQIGGDDESKRQCPACKRSLDDVGTIELKLPTSGEEGVLCGGCRFLLRTRETNQRAG